MKQISVVLYLGAIAVCLERMVNADWEGAIVAGAVFAVIVGVPLTAAVCQIAGRETPKPEHVVHVPQGQFTRHSHSVIPAMERRAQMKVVQR